LIACISLGVTVHVHGLFFSWYHQAQSSTISNHLLFNISIAFCLIPCVGITAHCDLTTLYSFQIVLRSAVAWSIASEIVFTQLIVFSQASRIARTVAPISGSLIRRLRLSGLIQDCSATYFTFHDSGVDQIIGSKTFQGILGIAFAHSHAFSHAFM
jgi:hypothetical protein